jgi:transcription initiation factor TFIIIB Brf1 subunit/transcription initiation factor TFIIB
MDRACPKCGGINHAADGSTVETCPHCGVVYAKVGMTIKPRLRTATKGNTILDRKITGVPKLLAAITGVVLIFASAWFGLNRYQQKQIARQQTEAVVNASIAVAAEKRAAMSMYTEDIDTLSPLFTEWDDQMHVTANTPRIALGPRIDQLAAVIAHVRAVHLRSACTRVARDKLAISLAHHRDAVIEFLGQSHDDSYKQANDEQDAAMAALAACKPET